MNRFESFLFIIFPEWQLNGTPWKLMWLSKRQDDFLRLSRFVYIALMIAYPLHYFFVDSSLGLTKNPVWAYYRFGLAGLAAFGFILSFTSLLHSAIRSRIIFLLVGLSCCYFQAQSMNWYSGVPYFWGLILATLFAIFSLLPFVGAVLYAVSCLAIQWLPLAESGLNESLIFGAFAVTVLIVMVFKYSAKAEIKSFIISHDQVELQAKVIESQKSLNSQIQAFLPKKIRERLNYLVVNNRMNVLQAIDEVLRVRERFVVALFSDIRGYTLSSKTDNYIKNAAIPNMKVVTDIVEKNGGIPRLIGDLVFSYFDEENFAKNIEFGFTSAAEILEMNERFNHALPQELKVTRYVLMDGGKAFVGNIGGIESAREVTAMGSCVNRLSRMDALTKDETIISILGKSAILMSAEMGQMVEKTFPALVIQSLDLKEIGLQIKDFPEESKVRYFRLSDQSFALSFDKVYQRGA